MLGAPASRRPWATFPSGNADVAARGPVGGRCSRSCALGAAGLLLLVLGCGPAPEDEPVSVRLTDLFPTATISVPPEDGPAPGRPEHGRPEPAPEPPGRPAPGRSEWRFAEGPDGWESFHGVTDLAVSDGRLSGTTSDEWPILHVERTRGPQDGDLLHAVEVRLRVSAGTRLSLAFSGKYFLGQKFDRDVVLEEVTTFPAWYWYTSSPLVPGDEVQTYVMTPERPIDTRLLRHVLLRPTDVAGATFAVESVRLIFRREHLAAVPSGVGWHGAGEIYRESVVTRVPEIVRYRLRLPARPWLELALATFDADPVTFRVQVTPPRGDPVVVLERTVTTPLRWHEETADLGAWAGQEVELTLSPTSRRRGAVTLWGSPAIRSLGAGDGTRPRGVLLIVVDTLRPDHLDAYGYSRQTAPTVSRLAAEGARFENCTSLATWTKVSIPSILTGLEPLTHGVLRFSDRLPPSAVTLAEVFRDAGYATLSFVSIQFAGQYSGNEQGFEVLHDDQSLTPNPHWSKTGREYVQRLLPWLEAHREVPFFVVLHVLDPHSPYEPRPPWDREWVEPRRRDEHRRQARDAAPWAENPLARVLELPEKAALETAGVDAEGFLSVIRDWYDASILGLDAELTRLFEQLRHLGLDESTLVVLTSDHGEELYEHGRLLHGHTVYGELARVPLILRGPGVDAGVVVSERVRTVDLMPTVLELSGLPVPEGVQGQSLVPLLRGRRDGFREQPALITRLYPEDMNQLPDTQAFAFVEDGWKLVEITERAAGPLPAGPLPARPRYELYDAAADPFDLEDLSARRPEVVKRLKERLEGWRARRTEQRLPPAEGTPEPLDAAALERLRSLGYVQ